MLLIKIISLFLVFSPFLSAEDHSINSLNDLQQTFSITGDVLISAQGKEYLPHPFESKFHSELAYVLKDLKQAKHIYAAYNLHISPVVSNELEEIAFKKALFDVCLLFGNPKDSPQEALLSALYHQGPEGKKWIKEYLPQITDFVGLANQSLYPEIQRNKEIFTVVVLTTTCSGGNLSIANALTEHLGSMQGVRVIQIDTEDIAKEVDPVIIATSTLTYEGIYANIFQKTNDFSVISERKELNKEIHRFIPSNFLSVLKEKVIELEPDLIISTRSYLTEDIALSTLGVPFRMMHVDFELCSSLNSYYRKVPAQSIRFWVHSFRPSMFKPLFEAYDCLDLYSLDDSLEKMMGKMSEFLNVPLNEFKEQFEVIGYPTSSEFYPIEDQYLLNDLRSKWGVLEKEIPIFIMMGKHSTGGSKRVFNALLNGETELPLKYLFICGKNEKLKEELELALLKLDKVLAKKFDILGLLSPKEMNEIMNISKLGISKSGASSVIEIMATKGYALLMHSYPWEKINGSLLVEMGGARQYDSTKPLMYQIEQCLKNSQKRCFCDLNRWQENLDEKINQFILEKKKKVDVVKKQDGFSTCSQNYISYQCSGGRFGDNLIAYLHGKWLSFQSKIPFLYKPFPYSSELVLDGFESKYEANKGLEEVKFRKDSPLDLTSCSSSKIYTVHYFPESAWEKSFGTRHNGKAWVDYFSVDWKNPEFRKEIQNLIQPKQNLCLVIPSKASLNVAIHFREGGGFDQNISDLNVPLKFPSLDFYINGLLKIADLFKDQPIYCFLFTDAKNPNEYLERIKASLPKGRNIVLDCRSIDNVHDKNVLEDFFSLFQFDALIYPQSNFSMVPALIHDYALTCTVDCDYLEKDNLITQLDINETLCKDCLDRICKENQK